MRILLLGKNGQVDWELKRSVAPLGEIAMVPRVCVGISLTLTGWLRLSASWRLT